MAAQFTYPGQAALSNDLQSKAASITSNMLHPPHHRVLDGEALDLLHKNFRGFTTALKDTHPKAHTEESLAKLLDAYSLTPGKFRTTYLK